MRKLRRLISLFLKFLGRIPLVLTSLRDLFKYGGYSTVNVGLVEYGELLKEKKILITGGSSGIGLCIAKKCIQLGADVVITGRNSKKISKAAEAINSPRLHFLEWDIAAVGEIEVKLQEALELAGGELDILINNAGILSREMFPNVTEADWDDVYTVNSKGLFFLTQAVSRVWMNTCVIKTKKIINISSQGGYVGATYPYRMTKWDIAGLTQGLGVKLAPYGILVNGIAPGIVVTNMQKNYVGQGENRFCEFNPLRRIALPEEIAEFAAFLMSDAGNFFVGQTFVCDGGFSLK
jgi:3-oxoacyl-[acyl-carrier protein] reductase